MPDREERRDPRWDLDRIRAGLVSSTSGTELTTEGLFLRVSDLPLFQRGANEELRQVVRVWAHASAEQHDVTFTLLRGDAVVDRVAGSVGSVPQALHLLVPELNVPDQFHLEVTGPALAPLRSEITVRPQRKWTVFLVHHSHLDIGYTDPQASVLQHQLAYLDAVLDHAAATDDWPDDARFRWNVEVTWPLQHWLRVRPKGAREALIERIHQGRIEINALPFSMHTEAYSMDELARQLWFADELRDQYGVEIVSAMQTDVPGATVGLASLLTSAGIRNLAVAHNYAGRSVPHLVGGQELTRPFYWAAPDGSRLLVWYTDTPHGVAYMEGNLVGLGTDYSTASGSLPEYLNALAQRPYPYGKEAFGWAGIPAGMEVTKQPYPHDILHLRVQSVIADNAAPSLTPAAITREWNERWAFPRLRLATNREFFATAEERLGDQLQTYTGDWTDWWADGIGSGARPLGFNRRAQSAIRAAQTLHALADVSADDPQPAVTAEVDRAYEDMALFDEHTWGAANPWEDGLSQMASGALQWARKAAFAQDAYDRTNALVDSGLHRFAASVAATTAGIVVFNPSAWRRTDLVRVFLPASIVGDDGALVIRDVTTGDVLPHVVEPQEHTPFRPHGCWASFVARDIPPLGYARYDLVRGERLAPSRGDTATDAAPNLAAIENEHFHLELDARDGLIRSLVTQGTHRELIDQQAPHGFNQYVYDRYTSAPGFNHLSGRITADDLALLGSRSVGQYGVVTHRSSTPVWDRVTMRLTGKGTDWIETTLTLLRGVPRLDIANRLCKVATPDKESVYFAFPFAVPNPSYTSEITGGVATNSAPRVPGSAHHFRALRHWVTIEGASASPIAWATLEAPLVQFGNIHLPYAPFPETIPAEEARPGTIYSWALNNIWDTNFPPQQGGEMTFHYAVATTQEMDAASLGRQTAAAVTAPLLGLCSAEGAAIPDRPGRGSFISIDQTEVEITHLTPSRRGHNLVVVLASGAASAVEATIKFDLLPVARAWGGTFLERELTEAPVTNNAVQILVPPGAVVTLSLDLTGR